MGRMLESPFSYYRGTAGPMAYDLTAYGVTDLTIVPKHFFTPAVIERRRPLADTARRAG